MPKIESALCTNCRLSNAIKFMKEMDGQYYCNICFKKLEKPKMIEKKAIDPLEAHFTNKELLFNEALEAHQWLTERGIPMIEYSEDGKLESKLGKYFILPLTSRLMMFELTNSGKADE